MKHTKLILSVILLAAFAMNSCNKSEKTSNTVSSKHINYKVIYLEDKAGDIPTNMLPDVMETYYTKNYVSLKIHGFFGQFSLIHIANLKKQTVTSMLNFFGNKVYYIGEKGELPVGVKSLDNPNIVYTGDTLTISGLPSYKATISSGNDVFDIYFTKEFDVKNPNITTTYPFIDYILSDFRVNLSALKMRMIVDNYEKVDVDSSVFEVPEDYKLVTKDTMERIINSLFTKE